MGHPSFNPNPETQMATLLDNELESHDGPEPRILTEDVRAILREKIRPGDEDSGESVSLIAERAGVSTRTVYRVLNPDEGKLTISLRQADNLCLAADSHLSNCRLVVAGRIVEYSTVMLTG